MEAEGLHRHMQILGGGDAAYYRAVTVSPPDIITPRVSHCTFWNVFELRFGLGPVKSLHIIISFDVFSVVKSILMFYALAQPFFTPFTRWRCPWRGWTPWRRFRMGGDLQRLLLLLLEPWVYRETGCRRSEPRISGWSWGGSGYFAVLSQRDAS